jgi:hypothetical protein
MKALAALPNTVVKISGLSLPGRPWTVATQGAVVRDTIDIFGVDRCMFASNFPPDSCVADYDTIVSTLLSILSDLSGRSAIASSMRMPKRSIAPFRRAREGPPILIAISPADKRSRRLEHDPEKWTPVFGKDHAPRIT